jgi:DNA topoisomerase-1
VEGSDDPDAALEDQEVVLPPLKAKDALKLRQLDTVNHETQPPARFTEALLIQTLEREGVGRPSTYATIISTVQDRGYVMRTNNQLVPTFTAMAVNHLLEKHFPDLVDLQFTARMEQTLDDIAEGAADSVKYLSGFYRGEAGLEHQVEAKTQAIDPREIVALHLSDLDARVRIGKFGPYLEQQKPDAEDLLRVSLPADLAPAELVPTKALKLLQEKHEGPAALGQHPETDEPIYVLSGRFGPYVQLGDAPANGAKDAKPRRASLLKGMKPETLTVQTALALLSLPRPLGFHPETNALVEAGVGRFGPYVKHGDDFRSLAPYDDVLTVALPRALELLSQPKTGRSQRGTAPLRELGAHPTDGQPVLLMAGRYGPYVKHGAVNATLPKGTKPETLTLTAAVSLIAAKAAQPPSKRAARKSSKNGAKPSTAKAKAAPKVTAKKPAGKTTIKTTGKKPATKNPTAPKKKAS